MKRDQVIAADLAHNASQQNALTASTLAKILNTYPDAKVVFAFGQPGEDGTKEAEYVTKVGYMADTNTLVLE